MSPETAAEIHRLCGPGREQTPLEAAEWQGPLDCSSNGDRYIGNGYYGNNGVRIYEGLYAAAAASIAHERSGEMEQILHEAQIFQKLRARAEKVENMQGHVEERTEKAEKAEKVERLFSGERLPILSGGIEKKEINRVPKKAKMQCEGRGCVDCDTKEAVFWRRIGKSKDSVCNGCGLYRRKHGRPKPPELIEATKLRRQKQAAEQARIEELSKQNSLQSLAEADEPSLRDSDASDSPPRRHNTFRGREQYGPTDPTTARRVLELLTYQTWPQYDAAYASDPSSYYRDDGRGTMHGWVSSRHVQPEEREEYFPTSAFKTPGFDVYSQQKPSRQDSLY